MKCEVSPVSVKVKQLHWWEAKNGGILEAPCVLFFIQAKTCNTNIQILKSVGNEIVRKWQIFVNLDHFQSYISTIMYHIQYEELSKQPVKA